MSISPKTNKSPKIADLGTLGFPKIVIDILTSRGFAELNAVQQASIDAGLLDGGNQLVVAPTSSGKTLVAELAAVHHAIHRKGVFYLVSLKALAEEKYAVFRRFWTGGDEQILRTAITTGDRDFEDEGLSQTQVTFATYEKFYILIRDNPDLLSHVSLIVVDEFQTLGDRERGAVLEMLLTLVAVRNPEIQIIGLSAALPNAEEIGGWLNARVCRTTTRDIPLIEEVWTKSMVYSKEFGQGRDGIRERPNPISSVETLDIVSELVSQRQTPLVVFCMTKPRTEELAKAHYDKIKKASRVRKLVEEVKQLLLFFTEGGPTGRSLMDVVDAGIAFHHSDLSPDERRVIEDKIRDGSIEVTYATTTLGQGINLPLATVVFDDVYRHWIDEYIDRREYINMAGRAGRRGLREDHGTSVLICRSAKDRARMNQYLDEETEPVESVLERKSLDTILLNLIASSDASNVAELRTIIRKSFFGTRNAENNPKLLQARLDAVPTICEELARNGFILLTADGKYRATELGRITSQKGISPATALVIIRRVRMLATKLNEVSGEFAQAAEALLPATIHLLLDADGTTGPIYRDGSAAAFLNGTRPTICALRTYDDPTDPLLILQIAWVLSEWVQGSGYQKLCSPFRSLREGQIRQCADHCAWMFDSAAAISRVRELGIDDRVRAHLGVTAKRLSFGVPESGVALSEVVRNRISLGIELGGIGRGKIMDLLRAGFDDLTKIVEADDAQLTAVTRNADQAKNLKTGVARFLDRLSNSSLADHTVRGRKLSCEEIVKRVYEKLGTEFEVSVYELLLTIGVQAELLDERKTPGCADILVHASSGNVQIECKTRTKGAVTNSEAFEVLGKTVVGSKPIAYVTVGKPAFVDIAVKNSYSSGVTLITHKTLTEAAIMVLEGKKTVDELLHILQLGHNVERSDLR